MKYFAVFDGNVATIFHLQWKIVNISDMLFQYSVLCGYSFQITPGKKTGNVEVTFSICWILKMEMDFWNFKKVELDEYDMMDGWTKIRLHRRVLSF